MLIFLAVLLLPPVELRDVYVQFLQPCFLRYPVLSAIRLDFQYLFSCKHSDNLFAKVARITPRYNMQFIGCLLKNLEDIFMKYMGKHAEKYVVI